MKLMNAVFINPVSSYLLLVFLLSFSGNAKVKKIGKAITLRQLTIKNVSYNSRGTMFAIPNMVTAGSVALFWVDEGCAIASVPSRLSPKHFVHSSGLFFLRKKSENDPAMAFISLPEFLPGYSVSFSETGDTLAIAGGERIYIYTAGKRWEMLKEISVDAPADRAVFSPDGGVLAVCANGSLLLFSTSAYKCEKKLAPAEGTIFIDAAFSSDGRKCALFECQNEFREYPSRIRIFDCSTWEEERVLPYFKLHPSKRPGTHIPLLSYGPGDSLLAISLPTTLAGRVYLIKSNDGTVVKEFKGYCHAFSPDRTLFAVGNAVYATCTWKKIGKISGSTFACAFSPTERVLVTVTNDAIIRFRVEE